MYMLRAMWAVIISVNDNFYEIDTIDEKLWQLYSRNQFMILKEKFEQIDVPINTILLRSFYNLGGKGYDWYTSP